MSKRTYYHAYEIAFSVSGSEDKGGGDISPSQLRTAIINRITELDDRELIEAIGCPFDTYEEETPPPIKHWRDDALALDCASHDMPPGGLSAMEVVLESEMLTLFRTSLKRK